MFAVVLAILVGAYLLGAIPFGLLVCRWLKGVDIRQHGSGNIGATNVARLLGIKGFVLVFALDFLKGAVPTLAALLVSVSVLDVRSAGLRLYDVPTLAGLAAIVGHMWPIYLQFKGGKGVATSAGVVFVLAWLPALVALAVWMAVLLASRYVSLASLSAAAALAAARIIQVWDQDFRHEERAITLLCLVGAVLVIVRHRTNIVRLWERTEPTVSLALRKEIEQPGQGG